MILWRLSNYENVQGIGGEYASGRWHTRGHRIVYCADHPAAAVLETLVHLEIELEDLPSGYLLLQLHVPGRGRQQIGLHELPDDWKEREDITRSLGDRWLRAGRSLSLTVPSALVPHADNFLLNPVHGAAGTIEIRSVEPFTFDPRMFSRS